VLVSPHRAQRPWQGAVEEIAPDNRPEYDPKDYLGPGNTRVGGGKNPPYTDTYIFDNDFQAMLDSTPPAKIGVPGEDLLAAQTVRGKCRVVCFSPKLNVTVAEMDLTALRKVVDAWTEEYKQLGSLDYINHVQIFENKGEMMGCSNPHPHGQIWSSEMIPEEPAAELKNLAKYKAEHEGRGLLQDYVELELREKTRLVTENDSFVALVPYWAVWPFEVLVISKRPFRSLTDFDDAAKTDLADMYRRVACRYDNLFKCSFPYSMGIHQAPTDGSNHLEAHFHLHFYPPLLRSATVRKFMVGFELLGEPQRDLTAEQAAARLRECSEVHYLHSK